MHCYDEEKFDADHYCDLKGNMNTATHLYN